MGLWGVLKKTRGADRACGVGEAFFWGCRAGRMLVISKYWQKNAGILTRAKAPRFALWGL